MPARAGDVPLAARVLAVGVVNLLQTLDLAHVVLAGTDLLAHGQVYLDAVRHAIGTQVPRTDWLTVDVTLSGLAADVIAAGAATQVLNAHYGMPDLAPLSSSGPRSPAAGRPTTGSGR